MNECTEKKQPSDHSATKRTKVVLFDFDGTLTAQHMGGAVFVDMRTGDDCWRPGIGQFLLSQNVASQCASWTFALIWDLVMLQKVCVGIVTMSDDKHGAPLHKWLAKAQNSTWKVFAGRQLVMQWLFCIARQHCKGKVNEARAMIDALADSGRFFVDAHFDAASKARHVHASVAHFAMHRQLDLLTLRHSDILMIDDDRVVLDDIAQHYAGMETALVAETGVSSDIWSLIVDKRTFTAAPLSLQQED